MAFEVPVFILVGISIVMYLIGFCSPALTLAASDEGGLCSPATGLSNTLGTTSPASTNVVGQLISIFTNVQFLALVGVSTVAAFFLLGSNVSIAFVVPIFMVVILINFFVLPISFIFSANYDPILRIIFGLFLNSMLILSIMEFVRR